MNYNNLVTRRQSNYKLSKENTIVNNISKGKIFEAELISKTELLPKESGLMKAYREKTTTEIPLYKISQKSQSS